MSVASSASLAIGIPDNAAHAWQRGVPSIADQQYVYAPPVQQRLLRRARARPQPGTRYIAAQLRVLRTVPDAIALQQPCAAVLRVCAVLTPR
ncbi:MAG: hypothetical protein IRY86_04455 [Thermorudis peleae]|nr:hypothetical protein [Thermorudis peleae]